ncbi:MAG: transcriptional repressor [Terracoccus sp.]
MDQNVSDSPRVAGVVARMRACGERVTPARRVVLRVVDLADRADEHLTAEMIGARVTEVAPSVHRATVYRTLTSLTEAGFLSQVHLGGAAPIYHLEATRATAENGPADPASGRAVEAPAAEGHGRAHAHVRCVSCGRVLDVPPNAFDSLAARLADGIGFALDSGRTALLGTCRDCRADDAG